MKEMARDENSQLWTALQYIMSRDLENNCVFNDQNNLFNVG